MTLTAASLGATTGAWAFRVPPVTNKPTLQECGACHMVFPPQMLPARSWDKLMTHLDNHFDENATVDAKTEKAIVAYLDANAADAPAYRRITGLLAGVPASAVPLRITDIPWWQSIHGSANAYYLKDPRIKSAANCGACHTYAAQGAF